MSNRAVNLACVIVALALTACGGKTQSSPHSSPPASLANLLPAPSELAKLSSDSAAERTLTGSQFSPTLTKIRVTPSGSSADYAPLPAGLSQQFVAVATYDYGNASFAGNASAKADWSTPPDQFYLGVADFASNRWVWSSASSGVET